MTRDEVGNIASSKSSGNTSFIKQWDVVNEGPYLTYIAEQPVTEQHIPYIPKDGDRLIDAGTPRATIAPSKEMPNGSVDWARTHQHKTV